MSAELDAAKENLREAIVTVTHNPLTQARLSNLVAKVCVAAVKDDRAKRQVDPVANLFDVFFNGRKAR